MKKSKDNFEDMVKALKISSRNDAFERNGGGQFVSTHKVHKNKKKYNRKRDRNIDSYLSYFMYYTNLF